VIAERLLKTDVKIQVDCYSEFQNPFELRWQLEHGADPNQNNGAPLKGLLSTYGRKIGPKHECIELLIEHGAKWVDDPVMAIHRGQVDRLSAFIDADPTLVHKRVSLDYGVQLTLIDVTLLHVAAEYNEKECVDLLLKRGADLNARAGYAPSGIGGQSPLYHTIGGNQGLLFPLFKHLLTYKPDLNVTAHIQGDSLYGPPTDIKELTPFAYAQRYADGPSWHNTSREVGILKELLEAQNKTEPK
jgi:hypothetical protein